MLVCPSYFKSLLPLLVVVSRNHYLGSVPIWILRPIGQILLEFDFCIREELSVFGNCELRAVEVVLLTLLNEIGALGSLGLDKYMRSALPGIPVVSKCRICLNN